MRRRRPRVRRRCTSSMGNPHAGRVRRRPSTTPGRCWSPPDARPGASSPTASTSSSWSARAGGTSRCGCTSAASGETRSCGTGACAAVAAALADGARAAAGRSTYRVDVPGGRLEVTWTERGTLVLDRVRRCSSRARRVALRGNRSTSTRDPGLTQTGPATSTPTIRHWPGNRSRVATDVLPGGYDERTRAAPRDSTAHRRSGDIDLATPCWTTEGWPRAGPRGGGRPPAPTQRRRAVETAPGLRPRRAARPAPGRRAVDRARATSPRSSTASSGSSGSCWSASGPRARVADAENSHGRARRCSPRRPAPTVLDALYPAAPEPRPRDVHRLAARSTSCARSSQPTGADTVICDGELAPSQLRNLEDRRQGQGRRPDRADPGHLRPARAVPGGQGPGRAGPAQLHEAAAARLGRQPVPAGRWPGRLAGRRHRRPWSRRDQDRDRPAPDQHQDRQAAPRARAHADHARHQAIGPPSATRSRRVAIAGYTNAGKSSLLNRLTDAGRAGRGLAVRDAGPDHPQDHHLRRPDLHDVRHGRLRAAPAAPARRGVPLDAGGGRRLRPGPARRRRLARRPRGPAGGRPRGARARSAPTRCPSSW